MRIGIKARLAMSRLVAIFEKVRWRGARVTVTAVGFGLLTSCTSDARVPTAATSEPRNVDIARLAATTGEIRLTEGEAKALLSGHLPALQWTQQGAEAIEMRRTARIPPTAYLINGGEESMVTSAGMVGGYSATDVSTTNLPFLAAWSSQTTVTSGFARRVHLTSVGVYTQSILGAYKQKQFSDTCGDGLFDLFKQSCFVGTVYTDIECLLTYGRML